MSEAGLTQTRQDASMTDLTGAQTSSFVADRPMKIVRWGFIATTALTTTECVFTGAITEADTTAASPTGAAQGGTMTCTVANGGLNEGVYLEAANFATTAPLTMVPGEIFTITSDGGPATGAGITFIEFEPLPFQDPTRPTADPGATQRATHLAAMTKVTS